MSAYVGDSGAAARQLELKVRDIWYRSQKRKITHESSVRRMQKGSADVKLYLCVAMQYFCCSKLMAA
jgi:hypothetical protein